LYFFQKKIPKDGHIIAAGMAAFSFPAPALLLLLLVLCM
jgi:hypothetical protein